MLEDYGVNSDNTVDHVGFKIIYKRHAYELYSPVTYRDMPLGMEVGIGFQE